MARTFAVGDLVRVAKPEHPEDHDFISRIAVRRDSGLYPYVLSGCPPSGANMFSAGELKRLGRTARRAYEAGARHGAGRD